MGLVVLSFLIVTVIVCAVVYFIFKKKLPNYNPIKNPYYWITSVIVSPIVFVGIIMIWFLVSTSVEKKEFNKSTWIENPDYRYELVDDLIDSNKLIGLTLEEIRGLLGEADYIHDTVSGYNIGYSNEIFMNLDPDWLEIEFESGKVKNTTVRP